MSKTNANFINLEGGNLESRLNAAHQQARADAASRHEPFYWVAYKFTVRPNVSVDAVLVNAEGLSSELGGVIMGNVGEYETRDLGIFLLYGGAAGHEPEPQRAEIYNLERERVNEVRPVYWLGEGGVAESLKLLEGLLQRTKDELVGGKLTEAIALHDGQEVKALLSELARRGSLVAVRAGAVFWLGRLGENLSLVEEVAADGRESLAVRQQAIMGIGKSRAEGALDALGRLLGVVEEHALREAVVNAIAKSRQPGATELLKSFSESSDDAGLRRRAQMQLLKASGGKSGAKEEKLKEYARKDRSWRL
jgi:hypothetical protein